MAIVPRKSKTKGTRYRVLVRDSFRRSYPEKSFATRDEAKRYERELLSRKDSGRRSLPTKVRNLTLASYWQVWTRDCRFRVSDGWKLTQEELWTNHISSSLGNFKVADTRSQHVGALLNHLEAEKGLGAQSRLHVYNLAMTHNS